MMRPLKILNNANGATILYVLIAVSFIVMGTVMMFMQINRNREQANMFRPSWATTMITEQVISMMENDSLWAFTISQNPSMQCLENDGSTCNITEMTPFDFYIPAKGKTSANKNAVSGGMGLEPIASHKGNDGFDMNSYMCKTYDAVAGDQRCYYKVRMRWMPVCGGACSPTKKPAGLDVATYPRVKLDIQIYFQSSMDTYANEQAIFAVPFEITDRNNRTGSLKSTCSSIGGDLQAGGIKCALQKPQTTDCFQKYGLHMVSYVDQNGIVVCRNPAMFGDGAQTFGCGPKKAVVAFQGDNFICKAF